MKDAPIAIDGSDAPLVVRKIVVWRRLEPGDIRTPGTELSAESPHLEAKVMKVGIAESTHADLTRLWKKKEEATAPGSHWTRRYEPAGVLFATGGGGMVGVLLDYLPLDAFWFAASLTALGVAVGAWTRARKGQAERESDASWRRTDERRELEQLEKRLEPRWKRFATKLLADEGFRTDVRVGDIHEADRLTSIDPSRISHPDTWKADPVEREVRYCWVFSDGRVTEQTAELEESDVPETKSDEEE